MLVRRRSPLALIVAAACLFAFAAPAHAGEPEEILDAVEYDDTTTYSCRTNALPIVSGQNLNLFAQTKTCPNAQVVSGEGDTSPVRPRLDRRGYITRFKPSMVEIVGDDLVTPSVWDLHLHHVVWLKNFGSNDGTPGSGPTFASGEEKTEVKLPQGYGMLSGGASTWGLNYMIHNLNASNGRQVYITWEIDWVPAESDSAEEISELDDPLAGRRRLPAASIPSSTPRRASTSDGDGDFTFPDDVRRSERARLRDEHEKISTRPTVDPARRSDPGLRRRASPSRRDERRPRGRARRRRRRHR